ncbi:hypothetical protein DD592_27475 [Enterobacter cloacae complex sp. 2DZ2F20B]|nr:hypothetical protein DD592_27475 [Enterobacter cloacae complex sp. 2DZ2F20B]
MRRTHWTLFNMKINVTPHFWPIVRLRNFVDGLIKTKMTGSRDVMAGLENFFSA